MLTLLTLITKWVVNKFVDYKRTVQRVSFCHLESGQEMCRSNLTTITRSFRHLLMFAHIDLSRFLCHCPDAVHVNDSFLKQAKEAIFNLRSELTEQTCFFAIEIFLMLTLQCSEINWWPLHCCIRTENVKSVFTKTKYFLKFYITWNFKSSTWFNSRLISAEQICCLVTF